MNKTIKQSQLLNKKYCVVKHSSGLKIVLYSMKGFSSYYALFGTKYGSVDTSFVNENNEKVELPEGIAHFLEHKLFESEDGDAFAKYAKTGAYSNAFTSFDRTCYLFSCSKKFYENLGILLDFVRSPYFTEATVQKEQGIIGQEIRMYDDLPNWRVLFGMLEGMFHSHPVRIDIAGTTDSIAKITYKTLYDCYNRFYDLSNMFLILAGDFNEDEVLEFVDKNLKVEKSGADKPNTVIEDEPDSVKENYVVTKLDVAKPLFSIGFKESGKATTPDIKKLVTTEILLKILVGSASPLYKKLLAEDLINEEFSFEYFAGRSFGLPMLEGESNNPKKVLELFLEQVENYKKQGIDKELFEAVRRDIYGHSVRRFDSAESICSMLADSTVLNFDLFQYFDYLNTVTPEDVAERLSVFGKENAVLSVVEPVKNGGK